MTLTNEGQAKNNEIKRIIFEERYPNISENAKSIWINDIDRASQEVLWVICDIFRSDFDPGIIEELAFKREKLEELEIVKDPTTGKSTLKYRGVILATSKESQAYKIFNNYGLIDQMLNEGNFTPESINAGILIRKEDEKDWKTILSDFSDELLVKNWKVNGFEYEEVEKWIKVAGLDADDYDFAKWLRDEKSQTKEWLRDEKDGLITVETDWGNPEWISNHVKDIRHPDNSLREEFLSNSLTMRRLSQAISEAISEGENALKKEKNDFNIEENEVESLAAKLQKELEEKERLEKFLREREEAHEKLTKDYEAKEKEQKEKDAKIKDLEKKEAERENHIRELEAKLEKLEEEKKNTSQTLITTKADYVEAKKEQEQEQNLVVNQIEKENAERIEKLQEKLSLSKEESNGRMQTINYLQAHLQNTELHLQDNERLIAKLNSKIEDLIRDKIDENEWEEKYGGEEDDKSSGGNHSRRTSSISTSQLGKTWLAEMGGQTCSSPVESRSASPTKGNFYHARDNSAGSSLHHLRDNSNSSRASLLTNASSASLSLDELRKKMKTLNAELGGAKKNLKALKDLLGFKNIEDLKKKLKGKNLNDLLRDLNEKQKLISLLSQNPQTTTSSSSQSGKKRFKPFKKKEANEIIQSSDLVSQIRQTYLDTVDRVEKALIQLIKSEDKEGLNEEAKNEFENIIGLVSPCVKKVKELEMLLTERQKEIDDLRSPASSPIPIPHLSTLSVADSGVFSAGSPPDNRLTVPFIGSSEGYLSDNEQLTQVLEKKQERKLREKVEELERKLSFLTSENEKEVIKKIINELDLNLDENNFSLEELIKLIKEKGLLSTTNEENNAGSENLESQYEEQETLSEDDEDEEEQLSAEEVQKLIRNYGKLEKKLAVAEGGKKLFEEQNNQLKEQLEDKAKKNSSFLKLLDSAKEEVERLKFQEAKIVVNLPNNKI